MNMSSNSDCSSGCQESGWTMYFDQSSNSSDQFERSKKANVQHEDMSMVSDASSGPPRQLNEEFYQSRGGSAFQQRNTSNQKKIKEYRGKQSHLDDTASSPILTISKENDGDSMENVKSFKGNSTLKKHFVFLKPSDPGKAASDKSGGRKWQ